MYKSFIFLVVLILSACSLMAQRKSFNTTLVSTVGFSNENTNDIWGYVDDAGTQYAIIGNQRNTRVYSLEDPTNPKLRHTAPGAQSTWRDIKSYNKHLYVTTDQGTDGLVIIDMTKAPDTISHIFYQPELTVGAQTKNLERCHNLYIDEKGFAYLSGCNISNRGVLIFDLKNDPKAPEYIGAADVNYSHDNFARGDTLYSSEINVGQLGIYDITDRTSPVLLASRTTSRTFTHNAWPSDDSKYIFTTDERPNAYVDAYDISDLTAIKPLDQFRPLEREGDGVIPHNTHYFNGYLVTSWYTDGLRIVDAHRPDNLIEVAYYDTWEDPSSCHSGFSGCWGAFPFTTNNLVYASDINNGLYILEVDYKRAAYLEGKVTNQFGNAVEGVKITIHSDQINKEFTSPSGNYKTGHAFYGEYMVEASHPEYQTFKTLVNFVGGEVAELDIVLEKTRLIQTDFLIKDENEGLISGKIVISNSVNHFELTLDGIGEKVLSLPNGSYDILVTAWGFKPLRMQNIEINADESYEYVLEKGYVETFETDLDWEIIASSANMSGVFERVVPRGTYYIDNVIANPEQDDPSDEGGYAIITQNGLPGAACADVDNGVTTLISPNFDLTEYNNPELSFSYWFFRAGGNVPFNDSLKVYITNGEEEYLLLSFGANSDGWEKFEVKDLKDLLVLTDEMRLTVEVGDDPSSGHIVEAGFDNFSIVEGVSSTQKPEIEPLTIVPNPVFDKIWVKNQKLTQSYLTVYNTLGQQFIISNTGQNFFDVSALPNGMYFIRNADLKGKFMKASH